MPLDTDTDDVEVIDSLERLDEKLRQSTRLTRFSDDRDA